jgi:hypothetical protein
MLKVFKKCNNNSKIKKIKNHHKVKINPIFYNNNKINLLCVNTPVNKDSLFKVNSLFIINLKKKVF